MNADDLEGELGFEKREGPTPVRSTCIRHWFVSPTITVGLQGATDVGPGPRASCPTRRRVTVPKRRFLFEVDSSFTYT